MPCKGVGLGELGDPVGADYDLGMVGGKVFPADLFDVVDAVESGVSAHGAVAFLAGRTDDQIKIVLQGRTGRVRPTCGESRMRRSGWGPWERDLLSRHLADGPPVPCGRASAEPWKPASRPTSNA